MLIVMFEALMFVGHFFNCPELKSKPLVPQENSEKYHLPSQYLSLLCFIVQVY